MNLKIDFVQDANELIDIAEYALLKLEKNEDYPKKYRELVKALSSLKDEAGDLGFAKIKSHVERLDNYVQSHSGKLFSSDFVDYLFKGLDLTRKMLSGYEEFFPDFVKISSGDSLDVKKHEVLDSSDHYKETVWLVDDEDDLLVIMDSLLSSEGYKVLCFSNPFEVIEKLETENPSLLISDFNMPEMSGFELMQKARQVKPEIPFMVISAFLDMEKVIGFHQAGVDGIFQKPIEDEFFLSQVKKSVTRYRALRLLDKSMHLITYYFSDLVELANQKEKDSTISGLKDELKQLYSAKALLDDN